MLTLSDDRVVALCKRLDSIEAECRCTERKITNLRMEFREKVPKRRWKECGFDESLEASDE